MDHVEIFINEFTVDLDVSSVYPQWSRAMVSVSIECKQCPVAKCCSDYTKLICELDGPAHR